MENLEKILGAIKKFLAKEFLWALMALLMAFLLALITKWRVKVLYDRGYFQEYITIDEAGNVTFNDITFNEIEYFLILCAFYMVCIYLIRMVVNAIKTLKEEKE